MRRILALVLSVAVVLALPVFSFAAGSNTSDREKEYTPGTTTQTLSDGTVVETTTDADGTVTTTTTTADGEESVDVKLSTKAANADVVTLKASVTATKDEAKAEKVKIRVPAAAGTAKVNVPVTNASDKTVVVKVNSDGSTQIVKLSTAEDGGMKFDTKGTATYAVIINDKTFSDVPAWAKGAVDFCSSHEIMVGTGDTTFDASSEITPAMASTVFGRIGDDVTTEASTGNGWEKAGLAWAKGEGYDVSNADKPMSRKSLMVMMYKNAGSPSITANLGAFSDASGLTAEEAAAATWCVQNGFFQGVGGGQLDPDGTANRGQLAAIAQRYAAWLNSK